MFDWKRKKTDPHCWSSSHEKLDSRFLILSGNINTKVKYTQWMTLRTNQEAFFISVEEIYFLLCKIFFLMGNCLSYNVSLWSRNGFWSFGMWTCWCVWVIALLLLTFRSRTDEERCNATGLYSQSKWLVDPYHHTATTMHDCWNFPPIYLIL